MTGTILLSLSLALAIASLIFRFVKPGRIDILLFIKGSFLFLAIALAYLAALFIIGDYTTDYVYRNSSRSISFIYRLSAVWAGQEGSFLLWGFLVAFVSLLSHKNNHALTPVILTAINILFIAASLFFANPFLPSQSSHADGAGLNSLLLNPWMAIHPPLLFVGYALSIVPYARAIASFRKGIESFNIELTRKYILFGTGFLTLGIFTGALWAYETLGWGGFWSWDPVENVSLIPWILNVALIHAISLERKGKGDHTLTRTLAAMPFVMVILGSFLTRSGILASISVHSFSESVLALPLGTATALSILLFLCVALFRKKYSAEKNIQIGIRDSIMKSSIYILIFLASLILLATVAPLVSVMITGKIFSFREGFFNDIALVFSIMVLGTISVAHFRKQPVKILIPCMLLTAMLAFLMTSLLPLRGWFVLFAVVFSASIVTAAIHLAVNFSHFKIPSSLCHIGFSLFAAGALLSGFLSETYRVELPIDKPAITGNLQLTYRGIQGTGIDRFFIISLDKKKERNIFIPFHVAPDGSFSATLPVIARGLAGDIYLFAEGYIPHEGSKKEEALIINITFKKSILLVWTGFFLIAAGLLLPLILNRRERHAD